MSTAARSRPATSTVLISTPALLLSACGGGGSGAAGPEPAVASTTTVVLAAEGTVASDAAQPTEQDAGVLQADGTLDDPDTIKKILAAPAPDETAVHLGDLLFHDETLSASGKMACGTCHVGAFAHADQTGTKLPMGGAGLDLSGMRSSMSVRYATKAT